MHSDLSSWYNLFFFPLAFDLSSWYNIFHFPLAIPSPLGYNTRMKNTEYFEVYDALMYERVEVEEVYTQNIDCQVCYDTGTVDEGEPCYCDRGRSLILNIRSL